MARMSAALCAACLMTLAATCNAASAAAGAAAAEGAAGVTPAMAAAARQAATHKLRAALDRTAGSSSIAEQIIAQLPHKAVVDVTAALEAQQPEGRRQLLGGHGHWQKHRKHTKKHNKPPVDPCDATFGTAKKVTAVLVADTGSFSGVAEGVFYASNLKNAVTVNANRTLCAGRSYGTLVGEPVILAATGIGPGAAIICLAEVLQCASRVKEVLYSGTSGWTPQVGGIINSDECGAAQPNGALGTLARIGDVCVSPFSMNWNCKLADYSQQVIGAPDLCSLPQETNSPADSFLYGECIFTTPDNGSMALTNRIYETATSPNGINSRPVRTTTVSTFEDAYFKSMGAGTGVNYGYSSAPPARVWDYKTCMEVDSQFFYSGPPYDEIARVYIQNYLSAGLQMNISKKEVLVVSAMEAVGVMELLTKWSSKPQNPKIPYVMVRGNSDYLYKPITKLANGTWGYEPDPPEFNFSTGYAYAIATTSNVVLQYLKTGCIAKYGARSARCTYIINYPGTIPSA